MLGRIGRNRPNAAWLLMACAIPCVFAPCAYAQTIRLDSNSGLRPNGVSIHAATYEGRDALQVTSLPESDAGWKNNPSGTGGGIALIPGVLFHNGTIEVDVAGKPQANAPAVARGFVGVAFRSKPDATKYECVYIRPTNGRADDQVRRNHSTQYYSYPNYEWLRLRTESPGKYESYVDLVPGEWTHLRVEVEGVKMRLFVNGAQQPTLIVNDLKMGDTAGAIGLWIGVGTEAYFADLRVTTSALRRNQ
jgi:hypothetical protein